MLRIPELTVHYLLKHMMDDPSWLEFVEVGDIYEGEENSIKGTKDLAEVLKKLKVMFSLPTQTAELPAICILPASSEEPEAEFLDDIMKTKDEVTAVGTHSYTAVGGETTITLPSPEVYYTDMTVSVNAVDLDSDIDFSMATPNVVIFETALTIGDAVVVTYEYIVTPAKEVIGQFTRTEMQVITEAENPIDCYILHKVIWAYLYLYFEWIENYGIQNLAMSGQELMTMEQIAPAVGYRKGWTLSVVTADYIEVSKNWINKVRVVLQVQPCEEPDLDKLEVEVLK